MNRKGYKQICVKLGNCVKRIRMRITVTELVTQLMRVRVKTALSCSYEAQTLKWEKGVFFYMLHSATEINNLFFESCG